MSYIELNSFLKLKNIAITGGQAKLLIRNKKIKVNKEIETKNKRKLKNGDIIEFNGKQYEVFL